MRLIYSAILMLIIMGLPLAVFSQNSYSDLQAVKEAKSTIYDTSNLEKTEKILEKVGSPTVVFTVFLVLIILLVAVAYMVIGILLTFVFMSKQ